MIQMIIEEDPVDDSAAKANQNFLSISPMIRETLENRRAWEIREGNHASVVLMKPKYLRPKS